MPGELVLVLGGARSGKSAFAERLATGRDESVLYLATARPDDAEMAARIAAHRARRPAGWTTVEAPLEPARALETAPGNARVVLLECLALLVSNVLLEEGDSGDARGRLQRVVDELLAVVGARDLRLVVVSAEVGLGLVPLSPLGRHYVDLLGDVNQRLAHLATRVYLVVAGLPVDLRLLAAGGSSGSGEAGGG